MKRKQPLLYMIYFLFVFSLTSALFAADDDGGEEKKEKKCWSCKIGSENHRIGDMNVNVGASFLFPMGDFYDRWNDGTGLILGLEFVASERITAGLNFSDIDLSPNPSGFAADLTDWKTTIYTWSVNPKFYLVPNRLYVSLEGGVSGLRRTIPNYSSLSAGDQNTLKDENSLSFFSGLGITIWNFILFETGYFHIVDEGGSAAIHFTLSF